MNQGLFQLPWQIDFPLAIGLSCVVTGGLLYLAGISRERLANVLSYILALAAYDFQSLNGDRNKRIKKYRPICKGLGCMFGLVGILPLLVAGNVIENGAERQLTAEDLRLAEKLRGMDGSQILDEIHKARQSHGTDHERARRKELLNHRVMTNGATKKVAVAVLLIASLAVVVGVIALAVRLYGWSPARTTRTSDAGAIMMHQRGGVLHGSAQQFSIDPLDGVWGVVMDIGLHEGVVSLVALADGIASSYVSSGGGVIGGMGYASVRAAAIQLCELAGVSVDVTEPATDFPLPVEGAVRFYLLTVSGVRTAEVGQISLHQGVHPHSRLFWAGHDVLTQLRLTVQEGDD